MANNSDLGIALNTPRDKSLDEAGEAAGSVVTSPGDGIAKGASPDAAKMAGTQTQKRAAQLANIRKTQASQTMTGQQRTEQARTETTSAEAEAQRKAAQLRQFGSLRTRVDNKIQQALVESAQAAAGSEVQLDANLVESVLGSPADTEEVVAELNKFYAGDTEALTRLSNKYGVTITPDNVQALVGGIEQATGRSIADTMIDTVTVGSLGDDQLAEMGIESPDEIADMLGIPVAQIDAMTIGELGAQIEAVQQAEFGRVQDIQRQLADPATGQAERTELLRQLRDLGGVGITGTEQQVESLADAVAEAGVVMYRGEPMSIEDFLADDQVTRSIETYLNENTDAETRADIEKLFGTEALDLIKQHSSGIKDLLSKRSAEVKKFDTVQKERKDADAALAQRGLDEATLRKLFPGYGTAGSEGYEWTDTDMYQAIAEQDVDSALDVIFGADVNEKQINNLWGDLTDVVGIDGMQRMGDPPELRKAYDTLKSLGADRKTGIGAAGYPAKLVELIKTKGIEHVKGLLNVDRLKELIGDVRSDRAERKAEGEKGLAAEAKAAEKAKLDKQAADLSSKIESAILSAKSPAEITKLMAAYRTLTGNKWTSKQAPKRMTSTQKTNAQLQPQYDNWLKSERSKTPSRWRYPSFEEWKKGKR